ncbi:hypothetical protein GCM10028784_01280 [Myceligenerans cantabricum]
MAAFWKLEGLAETTWTARVDGGTLTVSGTMFRLNNLQRAHLSGISKPRRRRPGGWPAQAASFVLLVALAWACFLLFEVLDPLFWIGPAMLVVAAGGLALYGQVGAKCQPFTLLEIEASTGYVVRIFGYNKGGELERLRDAVERAHRDETYTWHEEMKLLKNAHEFCELETPSGKVRMVS